MPNPLQHQIFGPIQMSRFHRRNSIPPSLALPHSQLVTFVSQPSSKTALAKNRLPRNADVAHLRVKSPRIMNFDKIEIFARPALNRDVWRA